MLVPQECTYDQLIDPVQDQVAELHDRWTRRDGKYINDVINDSVSIDATVDNSAAVVLEPEGDVDESRTFAMLFAVASGITQQQVIKAMVKREVNGPNHRMLLFPTNIVGQNNTIFDGVSPQDRQLLEAGDLAPYAELQYGGLDKVQQRGYQLGELVFDSYSFGGRTAASMAANNRDRYKISHINIDDAPSKAGRTKPGLAFDFIVGGGNINQAIEDAKLGALSEVASPQQVRGGLGDFLTKLRDDDTGLILPSMNTSIAGDLEKAIEQNPGVQVKVGYVEGSRMFDPATVAASQLLRLVKYHGRGFNKHATADNPIVGAAMLADCLRG